jgi:hypothetical protein
MTGLARVVVTFVAALGVAGAAFAAGHRVPSGVAAIDVRSSRGTSRHVTDPAKVARIVRWFDALPVARRGLYNCPNIRADSPTVRFAFRTADGSLLARANVLDAFRGFSGPCNPIRFSVPGHRERSLNGGRLLLRVQRLLEVRFG